ncbi:MAG: hypothetical protein ACE5KA_03085 [Nitrososphaerales archaeon]
MSRKLQNNPLRKNVPVKKESDRYLKRFFKRVVIQDYTPCCPKCSRPLFQGRGEEYVWCDCGAVFQLLQVDSAVDDNEY